MKKKQKRANINFTIDLDVNNIPENINWDATDSDNKPQNAKAVMISIWDGNDKRSLKIDLWTKEMMTEEMRFFIFQIIDSLSSRDTLILEFCPTMISLVLAANLPLHHSLGIPGCELNLNKCCHEMRWAIEYH